MRTFTLKNIDTKVFNKLYNYLRSSGTNVFPRNGGFSINGHGLVMDAVFGPATSTLVLNVQQKPFYLTLDMLEEALQETVEHVRTIEDEALSVKVPGARSLHEA